MLAAGRTWQIEIHRILTLLAVLALTVAYVVAVDASPARATTMTVSNETDFKGALATLSSDGSGPHIVELGADITYATAGHALYSGSQDLTIEGNGYTIDADGIGRILNAPVSAGVLVTLQNLTLQGGLTARPGGAGGAVRVVDGDLEVINSTIRNNWAGGANGRYDDGGGLSVRGDLTLRDSSVLGNTAEDGAGVVATNVVVINSTIANNTGHGRAEGSGVFALGDVLIVNSTITGNAIIGYGLGGAGIHARGHVTLVYSTVTGNSARYGANITFDPNIAYDVGLYSYGSVVASPVGSANCDFHGAGTAKTISTYSYDDDGSCGFAGVGDTSSGGDPGLGVLSDNGGPTWTLLPADGSPLIDGILSTECHATYGTDQRGISRPQGTDCDVGAIEVIQNSPPVADANGPYTANEGDLVFFDGTGSTDPDGDVLAFTWTLLPQDGAFDGSTGATPSHTFRDNYIGTVSLTVDDGNGESDMADASVNVANVPPSVGPITGLPIEPSPIGLLIEAQAGITDPGLDDTHDAIWDWGDGTVEPGTVIGIGGSITTYGTHTFTESGIYTVKVTVTDKDGGIGVVTSESIVVYDPSAGFVTGGGWFSSPVGAFYPSDLPFFEGSYYELVPVEPWMYWGDADVAANAMSIGACQSAHLATITSVEEQAVLAGLMSPLTLNAWIGGYQEPDELGTNDNWKWVTGEDWGYTNWAGGEPNDNPWGTQTNGSEQHLEAYQESGVWNDAPGDPDGLLGGETKGFYVVEYEGCDLPTGKATFGFVSKYKKGASVPTGNTEFQFHAGDLNFHSSSYDWLVVTGSNFAKFKGEGTINGEGTYKFQIWAGDDDPDTFRIKIWTESGGIETVVYDNGMNQPINAGNIVIHTKKK